MLEIKLASTMQQCASGKPSKRENTLLRKESLTCKCQVSRTATIGFFCFWLKELFNLTFLIIARQPKISQLSCFVGSKKIIEPNYFIFKVLGSIKNSSGALSLLCILLGQLAAELDTAQCFCKQIEMSNMNDRAQIFSKLLY